MPSWDIVMKFMSEACVDCSCVCGEPDQTLWPESDLMSWWLSSNLGWRFVIPNNGSQRSPSLLASRWPERGRNRTGLEMTPRDEGMKWEAHCDATLLSSYSDYLWIQRQLALKIGVPSSRVQLVLLSGVGTIRVDFPKTLFSKGILPGYFSLVNGLCSSYL